MTDHDEPQRPRRAIYAETDFGRLGACLSRHPDGHMQVQVWRPRGAVLGFYDLDRFDGGRLTVTTLQNFFTREMNS